MAERDLFTTTVDGAAAHTGWHGDEPYDDTLTRAELVRDEQTPAMGARVAPRHGSCPECGVLAGCWHAAGCSQPVDADPVLPVAVAS